MARETERILLTIEEAASQLGICRRTLQDHVRDGDIKYIAVGKGLKRRRRMFHPDDIVAFINSQRMAEACPSIDHVARTDSRRRSTATTSGSIVSDFAAIRAARAEERRKNSSAARRRWLVQNAPRKPDAEPHQ